MEQTPHPPRRFLFVHGFVGSLRVQSSPCESVRAIKSRIPRFDPVAPAFLEPQADRSPPCWARLRSAQAFQKASPSHFVESEDCCETPPLVPCGWRRSGRGAFRIPAGGG